MASEVEHFPRDVAPCVRGCPAGIDIPRYIGLVEAGRFDDAVAVVRERIPFPGVCGYVCYRPCEPGCRRGLWDAPVAIDALKRAAVEQDQGSWRERWAQQVGTPTNKRVAIVGSGPAGLTAAYYLGKVCGHQVTVFEAATEAGGQLRTGIPHNRMPRQVLDAEIALATQTRVEVRCNQRIGALAELKGFDAVLVAAGTIKPKRLGVAGEDLPNVQKGLDFLSEINLGLAARRVPHVGKRVAVIGGGNVAVDCARTARRLGAEEVTILYRRRREDMPAYAFEVRAAELEGVRIAAGANPLTITRKGSALAVALQRTRPGAPDASGRPAPEAVPGSEFSIVADLVIAAIGQDADPPASDLKRRDDGTLVLDPNSPATRLPGVFAAGDVAYGPDNVIQAIAAGRKAAAAIDQYLGGSGDVREVLAPPQGAEMAYATIHPRGTPVQEMSDLPVAERMQGFALVEQGYSAAEAQNEARRCVRCDLWGMRGAPVAWWANRGLQPYWLGGEHRRARVKDRREELPANYDRKYTHAPYIPAEYVTEAAEEPK